MKVICKENTSKHFDLTEVDTVSRHDVKYDLILEKEYIVMGLSIYKDTNCLYYLIDDNHHPFWYPYPLFIVSDNRLPSDWSIKLYDKKKSQFKFILIGFLELDALFHDSLLEREKVALSIYFKRKAELEQRYKDGYL